MSPEGSLRDARSELLRRLRAEAELPDERRETGASSRSLVRVIELVESLDLDIRPTQPVGIARVVSDSWSLTSCLRIPSHSSKPRSDESGNKPPAGRVFGNVPRTSRRRRAYARWSGPAQEEETEEETCAYNSKNDGNNDQRRVVDGVKAMNEIDTRWARRLGRARVGKRIRKAGKGRECKRKR